MKLLAVELLTPVCTVTLWEGDEPIGTCGLNAAGKPVVQTFAPERQTDLQRLIDSEWRVQTKAARKNRMPYDASLFLRDLPRALGSCPVWATRPTIMDTLPSDAYVVLPPLDLMQAATQPRRPLRRKS